MFVVVEAYRPPRLYNEMLSLFYVGLSVFACEAVVVSCKRRTGAVWNLMGPFLRA